MKKFSVSILILLVALILWPSYAYSLESIDMEIQKNSNSLIVKARIIPSQEFVEEFKRLHDQVATLPFAKMRETLPRLISSMIST